MDKAPTPCGVCGSRDPVAPEFEINGFSLGPCPRCGVRRVFPHLTSAALQAYYDGDYWRSPDAVAKGYFDYSGDAPNIRRTFRRRLARLAARHPSPGRLLDVGCACGYLLAEAGRLGWKAQGLEWSAAIVAQADPAVRPLIHTGTLREFAGEPGSWDLITFWDYLEHSPAPQADMAKAAGLLRVGGILSVIIPDAGSWLARLQGPRWEEYKKPEEHLYFFTCPQLVRLARACGLRAAWREWAGKYASLGFALTRFQPGDGLAYGAAAAGLRLVAAAGWQDRVVYINPRDKRHVVFVKERTA